MRAINRLTARAVQTIQDPGRHADGGGLYLSISANGGRRWVFLFRWRGKPTEMGLGPVRDVSLAEARSKAAEARRLLIDRVNPLEARRARQAETSPARAPTFGQEADALLASMSQGWRNARHRQQWETALGKTEIARGSLVTAKALRPKRVDAITTEHVLEVLRPVWMERPESASRLRARIEAVLDAAKARGHRSGENPARWKGHLDRLLPRRPKLARGHHKAMPIDEVPAFFAEARAATGSISALALAFLILTASRTSEVIGARWGEVDFTGKVWTVPAERMKGGRAHRVPLAPAALDLLKLLGPGKAGELIFPGAKGKPLSTMALAMALRRLGGEQATVHGFRSSFSDWVAERTNFGREVAEAALAHLVGDEVERAYRRGDILEKRRRLMEAWASFLTGGRRGNVVPIASGART